MLLYFLLFKAENHNYEMIKVIDVNSIKQNVILSSKVHLFSNLYFHQLSHSLFYHQTYHSPFLFLAYNPHISLLFVRFLTQIQTKLNNLQIFFMEIYLGLWWNFHNHPQRLLHFLNLIYLPSFLFQLLI